MTTATWIEALGDSGLTDADADRIEAGFRVLARACVTWPSPRELLDALPPVPRPYFHSLPVPALTPEQDATDRAQRGKTLAHVRDELAPYIGAVRVEGRQERDP